jgi:hypothetical protein
MEIDSDLKMLNICRKPRAVFFTYWFVLDHFKARIDDAILQIAEHVGHVAPDQRRNLGHRGQAAMSLPPEPAGEELLGRIRIRIVTELAWRSLRVQARANLRSCVARLVKLTV